MSVLRAFPVLAIPVILYNAMALASGGITLASDAMRGNLNEAVGHIAMPVSSATWAIQTGDVILFVALIALFFDVIASSRSGNDVLMKHVLSMLLFVLCLVEFLLFRPFATSTFFLLTAMVLLETIGGFVITTVAARKDIEMAH